jgi:hypothetical protein
MNEKTYEHSIVIDEYVTVKLNIPVELSAMTMKALMFKVNKLFNISEVPMKDSHHKRHVNGFSMEERAQMVKEWRSGDESKKEAIMKKLNLDKDRANRKIWYYAQRAK